MSKINTVESYDPNAYCDEYPDTGMRGNDVMGGLLEEVRAQDEDDAAFAKFEIEFHHSMEHDFCDDGDDDDDGDELNDPMDSLDFWESELDSEQAALQHEIEARASDWLKERDNALGIKRLYELDDTVPF